MEEKYTWWKHGVVYHLYVRSFYDSNNDGIGDLRGIIEKLDYLKELGIDAIWLSPIFKSPQKDFGYDIEDYQLIEPQYGSNEDFAELLKKAHQKGIKIILDMVLNHSSNKHPWFIESRSSTTNPKRNWYIWKKKIPNNWKTFSGSKAWCYDELTDEYYLHSFYKEQPDLNWRNDKMKNAMFKQLKHWLDKGVDGFRLDVINYIAKDKKYRDNPNLLQQLFFKGKTYNRNRKKSIAIVKSLRKLLDNYQDKVSIGEIYTLPPGDSKLVSKYLGNGKNALHLALDFSLMFTSWNPRKYAQALQHCYKNIPKKGWPSISMSNHDITRSFSKHFFFKTEKSKLMAIILLTAYGTPFIYYGEEIGLSAKAIPRRKMQDQLGKKFWPFYQGRDRLRSPMQWNDSAFGGFSNTTPWLPLNDTFHVVNVDNQKNDEHSLFSLFKKLIKLRKELEILQKGDWQIMDSFNNKILAYKRIYNGDEIFVFLNFSNLSQNFEKQNGSIVFSTHSKKQDTVLNPFEGRVIYNESRNR